MKKQRQEFLAELKKYGIAENIPNISEENGEVLHFLVRSKNAATILEIGCANGYSTIWLADAIEDRPGARLLALDRSAPTFAECQENIQKQKLDHIVELRFGRAQDLIPELDEKFDVIFIDAQKALYHDFWALSKNLINENGLVIVDDVLKFPEKTAKFHETINAEEDWEKVILKTDEDDGIMLIQRR